jgi:hypothetical protein
VIYEKSPHAHLLPKPDTVPDKKFSRLSWNTIKDQFLHDETA